MKRIVVWTTFATECLDQIEQYIIWRTGSKTIAGNFLSKIIKRAEQLEAFSESGPSEPLLKTKGQNSRHLVIADYKIIYQFNEKEVIITDVFHTSQNPEKLKKHHL